MLNLRRCVVGVVAVLLMGAAGCSSPSQAETAAQITEEEVELANAGDVSAQLLLGLAYEFGLGVPQDYVEAHKWFNIAASLADEDGDEEGRKTFAENRDGVAEDMTPQQIAEAQKLAREWLAAHPPD